MRVSRRNNKMRQRHLLNRARALRKEMTDAERLLWRHLRNNKLGVKFRRQEVIGSYIVDFVSYAKKLIIEVDGGQHLDSEYDKKREEVLKGLGFRMLRFWNNEVLGNTDGVMEKIWEEANSPSHKGRGKRRGGSPPTRGGEK